MVSEGERGLLGVGYTPARVVATAPAAAAAPACEPEPPRADENELEHRVRELVERVVGALGIDAHVDARQRRATSFSSPAPAAISVC